jgi:hypothetical protein
MRCIRQRVWDTSDAQTRQLDGVGPVNATALARAGIRTVADVAACEPHQLELVCMRHPPFGRQLRAAASQLRLPEVLAELQGGPSGVGVRVTLAPPVPCVESAARASALPASVLVHVGVLGTNELLVARRIPVPAGGAAPTIADVSVLLPTAPVSGAGARRAVAVRVHSEQYGA